MASRKHHKQDSTRPTKARSRRMRAVTTNGATTLVEDEEEVRAPTRGDSREG
jgi:hypothetical protein